MLFLRVILVNVANVIEVLLHSDNLASSGLKKHPEIEISDQLLAEQTLLTCKDME